MKNKVFISFVEEDLEYAEKVKDRLLNEGIDAWIYTEDNSVGDFRHGIMKAIDNSSVMVLIFSRATEESPHISKELREASEKNIAIIPYFIEEIEKINNVNIKYEIGTLNWIEGWKTPEDKQLEKLVTQIKNILNLPKRDKKSIKSEKYNYHPKNIRISKKSLYSIVGIVILLVIGYFSYPYLIHKPVFETDLYYVCYEKKSTVNDEYFYKGCTIPDGTNCLIKKKEHFGQYTTEEIAKKAYKRCVDGTPN